MSEAVLAQLPDRRRRCGSSYGQGEWGEAVHAIVRKDPNSTITDGDVILHSKKLIAGFKCPKSVSFREDPMPLSGAGKILKTTLREPFWEGHKKQVS